LDTHIESIISSTHLQYLHLTMKFMREKIEHGTFEGSKNDAKTCICHSAILSIKSRLHT
jgi:hypothetical protein